MTGLRQQAAWLLQHLCDHKEGENDGVGLRVRPQPIKAGKERCDHYRGGYGEGRGVCSNHSGPGSREMHDKHKRHPTTAIATTKPHSWESHSRGMPLSRREVSQLLFLFLYLTVLGMKTQHLTAARKVLYHQAAWKSLSLDSSGTRDTSFPLLL